MMLQYRVCTKLIKRPGYESFRIFEIYQVFHDKKGIPTGYASHPALLNGMHGYKELKRVHHQIGFSFVKPIINLDDFPNEYKSEQTN